MNYTDKQKQLIIENLKPIPEYKLEQAYNEMLDECYEEVVICGYSYSTSKALKSTDPTAYRCGFVDWLDNQISYGTYTDEIEGKHYDQEEVDELLESHAEIEEENQDE